MERLAQLLFEQPIRQALIELLALIIVVAGWWWARWDPPAARRWLHAIAAVLIVSLAGQVAQHLVVTDREQIEAMFEAIGQAVERRDVKTLIAFCDEDCDVLGMDRREMDLELRSILRENPIRDPYLANVEITFPLPNMARAFVFAMATVETPSFTRTVAGRYDVELIRLDGRWLITRVKAQERNWRVP